jgi:hypothetical protein
LGQSPRQRKDEILPKIANVSVSSALSLGFALPRFAPVRFGVVKGAPCRQKWDEYGTGHDRGLIRWGI